MAEYCFVCHKLYVFCLCFNFTDDMNDQTGYDVNDHSGNADVLDITKQVFEENDLRIEEVRSPMRGWLFPNNWDLIREFGFDKISLSYVSDVPSQGDVPPTVAADVPSSAPEATDDPSTVAADVPSSAPQELQLLAPYLKKQERYVKDMEVLRKRAVDYCLFRAEHKP